jgi:hypothetical protein
MSEESQIVVPPAFIALFMVPGRAKPAAPRQEIAQRHEFCEDLAQVLSEHARAKLWELGIAEEDVLERIHRGLAAGQAGVSPAEAGWVMGRVAELLGWPWPARGRA